MGVRDGGGDDNVRPGDVLGGVFEAAVTHVGLCVLRPEELRVLVQVRTTEDETASFALGLANAGEARRLLGEELDRAKGWGGRPPSGESN